MSPVSGWYGGSGIFSGGTAKTAAAGNVTVGVTELEDWQACVAGATGVLLSRACKWWIHPYLLGQTLLIRDTNKRPLFQTALEAPAPGSYGSILGYPVIRCFAAPSTDAAAAKVAVFGDPMGMAVTWRNSFQFQVFDQTIDYLKTYYRMTGRFGNIIKAATAFSVLTLPAA